MASPTLPWLWVIQALASCKEIPISSLQGLINVAPVALDDFCEKTRELLALRCLEDIFGSAHRTNCDDASSSLDSRVRFDFSLSCEDVLQQIRNEIPLSNLKASGPELSKWDIFPFLMHKRANCIKCDLDQLKESIFEGTHPYPDYIKSKSGLAFQNEVRPVHVNDGECNNDVSHDDLNLPFNSTVMLQHTSGGKYCQTEAESVPTKVPQPDKILRKLPKSILGMSTTLMPPHTSRDKYCQTEAESVPTKVPQPEKVQRKLPKSILGMSTTLMPPHTSGDEPCQNTSLDETKDDTGYHVLPIPKNVDDLHKVPNIINESQSKREIDFQLKEPNATSLNVSQQPVVSDTAVGDTGNACGAELSSDSDEYRNETIGVAAKKHQFLNSQCTFDHDFSACTEQTGKNFCVMCNQGGKLLVCRATRCPLMVHKTCLGTSVHIDADNNFICPFCAHCHAISEYLEAKKNASLARKELSRFINKDMRNQDTKLCHQVHRKEHSFLRTTGGHEHIHDKSNANDQFPRTEVKKRRSCR